MTQNKTVNLLLEVNSFRLILQFTLLILVFCRNQFRRNSI